MIKRTVSHSMNFALAVYGALFAIIESMINYSARAENTMEFADYWCFIKRGRSVFLKTCAVFVLLSLFLISTSASSSDAVLTELEKAFQTKDVSTATRILGGNVDPNIEMSGWPLIVVAANHGKVEIVREIIATRADINATNDRGDTALHLAAYNNYPEVVELLASHGASLDIRSRDGATSLIWAAKKGHVEVVRALLRHGADTNLEVGPDVLSSQYAPGRLGTTALIAAARGGHVDVVTMLLDAGADINATDVDCMSALRESIRNERHHVTSILESRGASKDPECLGATETKYIYGGFAALLISLLMWEVFRAQPGVLWRITGYLSNIFIDVFIVSLSTPVMLYAIRESIPLLIVIFFTFINITALVAHNRRTFVSTILSLNKMLKKIGIAGLLISIIWAFSGTNEMVGVFILFIFLLLLIIFVNIHALQVQLKEPLNKSGPA